MSVEEKDQISTGDKVKSVVFFVICALLLYSCVGDESYQDYKDKTLQDFTLASIDTRHEVVADYIAENDVSQDKGDDFYSCISEMLHTKSDDLVLDTIFGWCYTDYEQNKLGSYVNLDVFEKGFYRGTYYPLENVVKARMNDPDSYEHIATTYRLILNVPNEPTAVLSTEFRGKNGFGGMVKDSVTAIVDLNTGEIINTVQ